MLEAEYPKACFQAALHNSTSVKCSDLIGLAEIASVEHIDPSEVNAAGSPQNRCKQTGNDASEQQPLSKALCTDAKLKGGRRVGDLGKAYLVGKPYTFVMRQNRSSTGKDRAECVPL